MSAKAGKRVDEYDHHRGADDQPDGKFQDQECRKHWCCAAGPKQSGHHTGDDAENDDAGNLIFADVSKVFRWRISCFPGLFARHAHGKKAKDHAIGAEYGEQGGGIDAVGYPRAHQAPVKPATPKLSPMGMLMFCLL